MPVTTITSGVQYSGIWTMQQVNAAIAAGTWTGLPFGTLWSWGYNSNGMLGLGNTVNYSSLKQVGSLSNWKLIQGSVGGASHFLSIKTDGTLWSWGDNTAGQLGTNNRTFYSSPKQIGALTTWLTCAAAGYWASFAIKTDGTLWSWGKNNYGQLGLNNLGSYSSPKQVGSLTNWLSVACGYTNVLAIKTNGTLWGWGRNNLGQLGLGNTTDYSSPIQIGALTNWSSVSGGRNGHTIAIKTDGTLWAWGNNSFGKLGLGNTTNYSSPVQVGSLTNWSQISASTSESSYAVKTDGTLWSWGRNANGQLGLNISIAIDKSSPTQIGTLTTWLKVVGTYDNAYAIGTDASLWGWGNNQYGQLGLGNTTQYSSPKQIGTVNNWYQANGNFRNLIAIRN